MILKNLIEISLLFGCFSLYPRTIPNTDSCESVGSNMAYIKSQTETALKKDDLDMAKYHTYKALNGIWKAKASIEKCGCAGVIEGMQMASQHLKEAIRTYSIEDSKTFLHIALQRTLSSIVALKKFGAPKKSNYRDDILTMNTHKGEEAKNASEVSLLRQTDIIAQIENSLSKFESSLYEVVSITDCYQARDFIEEVQGKTSRKLNNPDISEGKQYYHSRVLEITQEALLKLPSKCPTKGLLARK
ncbi:MAG: hypothetical protein AAGB24_08215 [Bacteroidota bacterium]